MICDRSQFRVYWDRSNYRVYWDRSHYRVYCDRSHYRVYYKLVDNQVKKQLKNPTNNLLISVYTCSVSTNNIKDYN